MLRSVCAAGCALILFGCGGSKVKSSVEPAATSVSTSSTTTATSTASSTTTSLRLRAPHPPFRFATRVLTLVDHTRVLPGTSRPRPLVTIVRLPLGDPGPRPLVVFGHGFAVTPAPYSRLLDAWAHAGYVVAAPIFPLGNGDAPGGPNESDLVNQPRDMSFVITELLHAFRGRVNPHEIAVTGQSDGGDTALGVAYDPRFRDRRVRAAMILSGAEIPFLSKFTLTAPMPPLLATQGTADTINPPSFTHQFYDSAPRPKFLLTLLGASHLGPYTDAQPQLGVVERVTLAFMNHYLQGDHRALQAMIREGDVAGISTLMANP